MSEHDSQVREPTLSHWDGRGNALMIYADETVHIQNAKTWRRMALDTWLEAAINREEWKAAAEAGWTAIESLRARLSEEQQTRQYEANRADDAVKELVELHASFADTSLKLRDEEERHAALQARCYEGFPSGSDGIFDALKEADEHAQERSEWFDSAERSSSFEAATVLLKALGWSSGGLGAAAIEIVHQRDASVEYAENSRTALQVIAQYEIPDEASGAYDAVLSMRKIARTALSIPASNPAPAAVLDTGAKVADAPGAAGVGPYPVLIPRVMSQALALMDGELREVTLPTAMSQRRNRICDGLKEALKIAAPRLYGDDPPPCENGVVAHPTLKCADEGACDHQPWCRINNRCEREARGCCPSRNAPHEGDCSERAVPSQGSSQG